MRLRPPVLAHLRFAERQTDLTGLAPEPLGCRRTCNVQRSELARKSCIVGHLMPERRIRPGLYRNNVRSHAAPIAPSRQMEGPLDALDDLRLPRAIATSSARHTVEHHLTAHNLAGRFHEIVGYGEYGSWGRFLADECQGRTDGSADAGTTASILTVMLDTLGRAKC
jgi:hypothetical protein